MLNVALNKGVKPSTKPTLPVSWHGFTLLTLQAYHLNSNNYPRRHINCTILLPECHFPISLHHTENISFIEAEQRYLCIDLYFTRQI